MTPDHRAAPLLVALTFGLVVSPTAIAQPGDPYSASVSQESGAAQAAETSPDVKAEQIALSQPNVRENMAELTKQANLIHDPKMRKEALEILARPRFSVVDERRPQQSDIQQKLKDAGLLEDKDAPQPLFPEHSPMRFDAAPASFWIQHHTYPGGLSYHTATNMMIGLNGAQTWPKLYKTSPQDLDILRLAIIWHDSAKTMTIAWQPDGTASPSEGGRNLVAGKIAGTGAHHIWGVAEAVSRGESPDFIVTLASAHSPPHYGKPMDDLIGYLKAAAIIAGKDYIAAGLTPDGKALAKPPALVDFTHFLSDHDSVGSEESMMLMHEQITSLLKQRAQMTGQPFSAWDEDLIMARYGDLKLYDLYSHDNSPDRTLALSEAINDTLSPLHPKNPPRSH